MLERNLGSRKLPLQIVILGLHMPQSDVAAPHAPHARNGGGDAALDLGENPKYERLEHRHPAPRVDLRRNEQDVPQGHGQEQIAGALADVEERHN